MKKFLLTIFVALLTIVVFGQEKQTTLNQSTYYLIRHAEKVISDNPNPELDSQGELRANKWAKIFKDISFDAVYSTNYIRTRNTAIPTAESKGLDITFYHPIDINYDEFKKETIGKTILIVGHSNTIPNFVNQLIGQNKYENLDENCYGNLYIVDIKNETIFEKLIIIN